MSPEQEMARGREAKAILENPLYKEAVDTVQKSIFDAFASTDPSKSDDLLIQRLRLKCLADIHRQLESVMNTGKLAEVEEERERSLAQRVAERMRAGIRGVM